MAGKTKASGHLFERAIGEGYGTSCSARSHDKSNSRLKRWDEIASLKDSSPRRWKGGEGQLECRACLEENPARYSLNRRCTCATKKRRVARLGSCKQENRGRTPPETSGEGNGKMSWEAADRGKKFGTLRKNNPCGSKRRGEHTGERR